jgi:[citrate (pro-3S)-lyase] ligase
MLGIPHGATICADKPLSGYEKKLSEYKKLLTETREKTIGKIGAVVMNCNPFTLGHRYLIEYAASKVTHLYIFAVEEDKSIFPFKDRFDLIKAGTAGLKNSTVLPSGKFIISANRVRKLLEEKDFDRIAQMVPETTLRYL